METGGSWADGFGNRLHAASVLHIDSGRGSCWNGVHLSCATFALGLWLSPGCTWCGGMVPDVSELSSQLAFQPPLKMVGAAATSCCCFLPRRNRLFRGGVLARLRGILEGPASSGVSYYLEKSPMQSVIFCPATATADRKSLPRSGCHRVHCFDSSGLP